MLQLDSWMGKAVKWFKLKQVMAILLPHLGLVLKDNVEKILSKGADFQAVHLAIHLCGKWPKVKIYLGKGRRPEA